MGKNVIRPLLNADNIVLLNPNPKHTPEAHRSSFGSDDGVVPHAINYQFMFIDLRPPPPLPPQPPPPPPQPSLLKDTSLCGGPLAPMSSADDYEEVCELGKGSFAVVKRVLHKPTGREYAMKVMDKKKLLRGAAAGDARVQAEQMAELQARVLMEARILRNIDHPNVIRFVDIFEDPTKLFLVMELVQGGELFDRLEKDGPFAEADARHVMFQLLSALRYLHERHIVHRDLKPENILLHAPPPGATSFLPDVRIADFGLAKLVGADVHFRAATFCGTPQYFAPEVLESRSSGRGYDRACDVWSVGVLMYNLLSASPPFADHVAPPGMPGSDHATIFDQIKAGVCAAHFRHPVWERVSPAAKQMICRMLVVDPRKRLSVSECLTDPWMQGESRATGSFRPWEGPATRPADEIEDSDEDSDGDGARARGHYRHRSKRQCSIDPRVAAPPPQPPVLASGLTQHMAQLGHNANSPAGIAMAKHMAQLGQPLPAAAAAIAAGVAPPPFFAAALPSQPPNATQPPHQFPAPQPFPPFQQQPPFSDTTGGLPAAVPVPAGVTPAAASATTAAAAGAGAACSSGAPTASASTVALGGPPRPAVGGAKPKASRGAMATAAAAQQRRALGGLQFVGGAGKRD